MSAVARIQAMFESGEMLRPGPEHANTVDLSRAVATIAGAPAFADEAGPRRIARLIGEPEHLVLVIADGLGMNLVERLPADSFLHQNLALELRAVFPSSTAPVLTALATGVWPEAHCVPTWFTYLPKAKVTALILPYVNRKTGRALTAEASYSYPLGAQAHFYRRDFVQLQPSQYAESLATMFMNGGRPGAGYRGIEAAVDAIIRLVRSAKAPSLTYLYYPDVDTREHADGPYSSSAWRELLRLDRELARLRQELPAPARIVLSADHGQIEVPDREKRFLHDGDALREFLRVWPPAGEPRLTTFHLRPGAKAGFPDEFRRAYGDAFVLLTTDEAQALHLFGPGLMAPEMRARVGDYIAIPAQNQALHYAGEPGVAAMRGQHGALSPEEMRIPLVVG